MVQSINLIPEQETHEQVKKKLVHSTTVMSVFISIIVFLIGSYYFYTTQSIKSQIRKSNNRIEDLRGQITELSEIEISARNLYKKFIVLGNVFSKTERYSLLLGELRFRKPEEISLESVDLFKQQEINLAGTSDNYVLISNFINNLLDKEFVGGNEELKPLFTEVSLTSVNYDKANSKQRFSLIIKYNSELLIYK